MVEEGLMERFGIEEIHQGYGQSEVMSLMSREPGVAYAPNSLGTPVDGIEVRILDDEDEEVRLSAAGALARLRTAASDHRVAMAMAVAALAAGPVRIDDGECVEKSFPAFWQRWEGILP